MEASVRSLSRADHSETFPDRVQGGLGAVGDMQLVENAADVLGYGAFVNDSVDAISWLLKPRAIKRSAFQFPAVSVCLVEAPSDTDDQIHG